MEQGIMAMPGLGFIGMLIVGALAGWIAEKVTKSDHGLLTNILVGIAGSFVGGWGAHALGLLYGGFLGNLIVASIGAIVLLLLWRALQQPPQRTPQP